MSLLTLKQISPLIDVQTFTSNGTWVRPSWVRATSQTSITAIGGGGGGGSGASRTTTPATGGGGGGGGGYSVATFNSIILGSTEAVVVGLGGLGATGFVSGNGFGLTGSSGSSSSFGNWVFAGSGAGGNGGTNEKAD